MNQNLIEVDIEQLRDDVNNKLEDSGWAPMLSPFINGLEFDMIMDKLVSCVNAEKRFTPRFKDIFNAFKTLLNNPSLRDDMIIRALNICTDNKGSTRKQYTKILNTIKGEDGEACNSNN